MTSSDLDLQLRRFRSRREGHHAKALAGALLDAGRATEALEVVHLSLLDGEPDPELLILEGRALYDQGDLREAQAALLRALKVDAQLKEAYRWLGQVLIERGDPVRAVQVFDRAVKLDPRDMGLTQALARAQRLAGTVGRTASSRPGASRAKQSGRSSARPGRPESGAARGSQPPRAQPHAAVRGRAHPDPFAEALQREPTTDAAPSEPISRSRASAPLPFEDEAEHEEDEVPTRAVEMSEELRRLRQSERPIRADSLPPQAPLPRPAPLPSTSALAAEDDESDPTSIVPSPRELEQLDRDEQLDRERAEALEDATMIGVPALLAEPGKPEQPDQVLGLLKAHGVFETAAAQNAPQTWARAEPVPGGGSVVKSLAIGWGLALLAAVGGYFAFQLWLSRNREQAERLVARAYTESDDGEHASLKSAEASLSEARQLDPRSQVALEALLYLQAMRVLEEGAQELAPLKHTLARAGQLQVVAQVRRVAAALAEPPEQQREALPDLLAEVRRATEKDARLAYLAGRLAQRLGSFDESRILLAHATSVEPRLGPAFLALGEQARMEGQLERAAQLFERALGTDKRLLRAELWLLMLGFPPGQADAQLDKLDKLSERVEQGTDPDRFLAGTVRAALSLSLGKAEAARAALQKASTLHIQDAELLAYFSEQALAAGEPLIAYRAAHAASKASGGAPRYQALLASALLQQPDGGASLVESSGLADGHGTLALARAEAALLTDVRDALERAKKELGSYRATADGRDDVEASALLMRVDLRLGANVESLLPAARALAKGSPDVVAAHLALAEALINSEQGQAGIDALAPALRRAPGAADTHYLLGRAQQLVGQADDARASLQRALTIAPSHVEARLALGRNMLDAGEYDAALGLLRGLEGRAGGAAVLGIIEALIGKRRFDDAEARIDGLPEPLKAAPVVAVLRARLALRQGKPAAAVELLAPLVGEEAETRTTDTLTAYGDALLAADRGDSAVQAYDGALELDASHPDALLGRARAALRTDKPDQALAWTARAEAALALRPRPAEVRGGVLVTAARADIAKQQFNSARDRLSRAIALPEPPSEAFFWLGEVLARTDMEAARKQYAKYLEVSPNGTYVTRAQKALGPR